MVKGFGGPILVETTNPDKTKINQYRNQLFDLIRCSLFPATILLGITLMGTTSNMLKCITISIPDYVTYLIVSKKRLKKLYCLSHGVPEVRSAKVATSRAVR